MNEIQKPETTNNEDNDWGYSPIHWKPNKIPALGNGFMVKNRSVILVGGCVILLGGLSYFGVISIRNQLDMHSQVELAKAQERLRIKTRLSESMTQVFDDDQPITGKVVRNYCDQPNTSAPVSQPSVKARTIQVVQKGY